MAQALEIDSNNIQRDIGLVRQQAVEVAESATQITTTANEVAEGAEVQLRVLERTVAIADAMNRGEGTLGRFLRDTTMYFQVIETNAEIQALLRDMRANPRKYINLTIF